MLGKHLLGIYEKALDGSGDWEERLDKARELGFDFLELSVDESDARLARLEPGSREMMELGAAIKSAGVPVLSMCLSAHRRFPLGSADRAVRARSMDILERGLDLAAQLGIRTIQLAAYDVYYEPSTPGTRELYYIGLMKAAELAGQRCIMLANEIMDTGFVNSIHRHMGYEREANSPWLRLYPDVGNLSAWGNDVAAELRQGRGSIVQVHLKDTLAVGPDSPGQFREVPFGSGCVDFPLCFSVLERDGYTGPYLIEMWHRTGTDDRAEISRARQFIEGRFAAAGDFTRRYTT